jgi:hypothetical protein
LTFEINDTIAAFVTTTTATRSNTTGIIATARLGQTFGQLFDRLAAIQRRTVNLNQAALAWGSRFMS